MTLLVRSTLYLFFFVVAGSLTATSQVPGTIDSSFATNGVLILQPGTGLDNVSDIAVLADDRILVAGIAEKPNFDWDVVIFRLLPDGGIDSSFGNDGWSIFDVAGDLEFTQCMTVQDDGKIIVAGGALVTPADIDFFVIRLNPDGALDPAFGNGGITTIHTDGSEDLFYGVTIQADGKIVLAGQDQVGGFTFRNPVVARLNNDGTLDTGFGDNGFATVDLSNDYNDFRDLLVLEDGSIIAAGSTGTFGYDVLLVKFDASGIPDNTFGNQGISILKPSTGNDFANCIMKHPLDGRILVGGLKGDGSTKSDFVLMSIKNNGNLDSTFAINGVGSININVQEGANDMIVQENGKIVLAGASGGSGFGDDSWAVVRFNEDGSPDLTFGTNGYTVSAIGSFFSVANAIGLQSDGKIIGGGVSANTNNDMAVVRYFGDEVTCPAPVDLQTTDITIKTATFSWTSEADAFQLKYREAEGTQWKRIHVPAGQTSVTISGLKPGTRYIWTVRGSCGESWTTFVPFAKFKTDMLRSGDLATAPVINLFPNPSDGSFTLELNTGSFNDAKATIQIVNVLGQFVISREVLLVGGFMNEELDLTGNIPAGNYEVRILVDDYSYSKQIIIQD